METVQPKRKFKTLRTMTESIFIPGRMQERFFLYYGDSFVSNFLRKDVKDIRNYKRAIKATGGVYFCAYGLFPDPADLIAKMVSSGLSFGQVYKCHLVYEKDNGRWVFGGNLKESSAAFRYVIFDYEFALNLAHMIKTSGKDKYITIDLLSADAA